MKPTWIAKILFAVVSVGLAGLQQPAQNVYEAQVVPAAGAWSGILFPSALFAIVASAIAWLRHKSSQNTSDLESQLILAAYAGSKTALHAAVDTAAAQVVHRFPCSWNSCVASVRTYTPHNMRHCSPDRTSILRSTRA